MLYYEELHVFCLRTVDIYFDVLILGPATSHARMSIK